MNPEKQRIAIAEACGWKTGYRDPEAWHPLPDFLHDLNAMHEAEKLLTKANWGCYGAELYIITGAHTHGISQNHHWLAVAFSTASQRAEAFLRTIGKWEESK